MATLTNPYSSKPVNPLSKPLYSPLPKPTTTTVGGISVSTTKPVLLSPGSGPVEPIKGDTIEPIKENKGFWASKSKKQKRNIMLIGVGAIALITVIVTFNKNK